MKVFTQLLSAFVLLFSINAMAFTPTASQLEQFKKLPKSQQEALARQYGVDLSSITGSNQPSNQTQTDQPTIGEREEPQRAELSDDERFNPKKDELKPFGYSLFAGEPTTFMPNESAAVPDTYLVGPGDQLNINFYGKESESFDVTVDREGRISIPDLTPVQVAGLTFAEVKALINAKVEQEVIGVKAFVSLGQLRSMRILVLGEAYKPGSYSVSSLTTVSHALFVSGGVSDIASLRNIQVKRAGKVVSNFDLYDLLIKGDSSKDIVLKPGDVVFVPSVGSQVTVEGLVKRPAIFELKQGETAKQLLNMAGGLKPEAYAKNVVVERFNNQRKEILSVDFSKSNINYIPQDGDRVRFNSVSSQYENSISLIGAVARPGSYQWYQGKRISDVLKSVRGDLLPQADLSYGLLIRETNINGDIEAHQFDVAQAIIKNADNNLALKANDKIIVFSRFEEKEIEKTALENMALSQEQQEQQLKAEQWHKFKQKEFEKYIGINQEEKTITESGQALTIADISKRKANEQAQELKTEDYAFFSRHNLLLPIIEKLKQQASIAQAMQLVEINGNVTYPGIYPLTVSGEVADLVTAAGGLLESAYTKQAEITRIVLGDASQVEHVRFDLESALKGESQNNISLRSKDSINIFSIPNWQENVKVELKGELKFPGTYTIRRGETLTDLLKRAGGFSEFAEQNAAIFTRVSIKEQEQQQLARLSTELRRDIASKSFQNSVSGNSLSYDEMDKLLTDLASVEAVGRLVIDLPLIVENKQNLVLQNGDTLYVPSKRDSISIIGEVNYSTSHLYKAGVSVDDYIDLSGGLKERAAEDRIYIIKANGSVEIPNAGGWFAANNANQLEPGDTIVVPMDAGHMDKLTLWSTATQIMYQLGVAVAAISGI
ncbi:MULTISPECIES: SLBB domain-containing protein [unclassified Pseudoalteromonas]|uniref:SLBB domain-containing protein n=1 Tax=unclassified Pseudoalteromonas TaxID=194690 RepID=UPI001109402B|nr:MULTISPECIES: SLBB domain-containing protein [unclassified Pseudoalteromonas]TMN78106.1 polysaccharide biosynthesis protein [Pseudoalteromonas sp. S410]TMN90463.1 polysaccharide biosynthesis protein [Pseudoalteromonas sp. S408]TMN96457.1 polysaccharide biosynthesis protein [Pseudoalteromonas sp. S407]TMO00616.1 polysaccharide biosynthesis protein [Pseudoalteromonas sp. S409]TMO07585.1 polysaccharide biosynthesis protein [Pseudoalteromonas sp. S186]